MSDEQLIKQAQDTLLVPANLQLSQLEAVLGSVLTNQVDYTDLYFQGIQQESWVLEDDIIKDSGFHLDSGVGIRAISGEKTGFAYSDDIILSSLQSAANAAKSIAKQGGEQQVQAFARNNLSRNLLYPTDNPLDLVSNKDKIDLLHNVNNHAKSLDNRVTKVVITLSGLYETVLILASDGTYAADIRPLVRLNVNVIVEQQGRTEQASYGGGHRGSYQMFFDNNTALSYADEAVRQAVLQLSAKPAPAGAMPVVLGSGWPGVLLHEAIGHGLEGDFNRKGSSAFSGRVGERVASNLCTIVDDGTLPGRRGSLNVDDEGVATQCTTLIENGILKQYMQDKLNAKLMGQQSTGNGRRESYIYLPMPRMTNTYMLAGDHSVEEIIANVDKGLYAVYFQGGQVDITSGKFVFSASEAYMIENGKISYPVKGATIVGNGPDVLTKVSMVGNDLQLDPGIGTCGKDGQGVPVGVGQPTLLVDEITVGGTQS